MADNQPTTPSLFVTLNLEDVTWGALRKFVALAQNFSDEQQVALDYVDYGERLSGLTICLDPAEVEPGAVS